MYASIIGKFCQRSADIPVVVQAMLKYDAASKEVQLVVDRDYKAGKVSSDFACVATSCTYVTYTSIPQYERCLPNGYLQQKP